MKIQELPAMTLSGSELPLELCKAVSMAEVAAQRAGGFSARATEILNACNIVISKTAGISPTAPTPVAGSGAGIMYNGLATAAAVVKKASDGTTIGTGVATLTVVNGVITAITVAGI